MNDHQQMIDIRGTFRHVDCIYIFYEKCSLIPLFSYFQKLVQLLKRTNLIRGARICTPMRLDYLSIEKLIVCVGEWAS